MRPIAGKAGLCLEVGIESEVRAVNGKLYAGSAQSTCGSKAAIHLSTLARARTVD